MWKQGFLATEGGYFEPEFAPSAAGRDGEEAPRYLERKKNLLTFRRKVVAKEKKIVSDPRHIIQYLYKIKFFFKKKQFLPNIV